MQYVLIIITWVNSGAVVHTQEFLSKERCEIVKDITVESIKPYIRYINCVQK